MKRIADLGKSIHPAHRRWRRLLANASLDPDELSRPLSPPGPDDFFICGLPRSGTALLTATLFQPPEVVTVMEPWDALRMPPADLFRSIRRELDDTGTLGRGRLDVARLRAAGTVAWCRDGEFPVQLDLRKENDYLLGVKFPALWRYLDLLPQTKFLVCLRNPAEVIRSFEATGGRLGEGLDYDVPFNRRMNAELTAATTDPRARRALLYDYIGRHLAPHLPRANVLTIRYERWFEDPDGLMSDLEAFLGRPLRAPLPVLRRAPARDGADAATRDLVRKYCPSAQALGYSS